MVVTGIALMLFLMVFTQPGAHFGSYVLALGLDITGGAVTGVRLFRARRALPVWTQLVGWLAVALTISASSALLLASFLVSGLPAAG